MTLKELARLLGLSPTTVSRALSGYPEVREETRLRVREAAARHGYAPNRRAAALATGRARAIGHVLPAAPGHDAADPVFAEVVAGAGEVYARAGYDLVLSFVPDGGEADAYRQMAAMRSVDGIMLHGPRVRDPRIAVLREVGLPFVVHGRASGIDAPYACVDVDNRRAFAGATAHLLVLGHRRIGLLGGPRGMDFARRREIGWARAMRAGGARADPSLVFSGPMSEGNGFEAAREMLRRPDPPTALLVSSLIMAIGARRAAEEAGLRLGRDLSVITHDDRLGYLRNGGERPIFTSTRSSVRRAGARCAEILLAAIDDPARSPVREIMRAELVEGETTGPPAPR